MLFLKLHKTMVNNKNLVKDKNKLYISLEVSKTCLAKSWIHNNISNSIHSNSNLNFSNLNIQSKNSLFFFFCQATITVSISANKLNLLTLETFMMFFTLPSPSPHFVSHQIPLILLTLKCSHSLLLLFKFRSSEFLFWMIASASFLDLPISSSFRCAIPSVT